MGWIYEYIVLVGLAGVCFMYSICRHNYGEGDAMFDYELKI